MALHVAGHFHQVDHHRAGIIIADVLLHPVLVGEQFFQHALGIDPLVAEFSQSRRHAGTQGLDHAVAVVHVVHCGLAGIGGYAQTRVERCKHVYLVLHRENATDDDGRAGYHRGPVLEHLWEVLEHAPCDALMLLVPDVTQFTQASLAGFMHLIQNL